MNVFITGGTSGIGLALARLYNSQGCKIGVCGGNIEDFHLKIHENEREDFIFFHADVTIKNEIQNAIQEFSNQAKGLDLIICSAGVPIYQKPSIPDFDLVRKMIDVHLNGMANTLEIAIAIMSVKKQGQIAVISSAASFSGMPRLAGYCATKTAINVFCETLAIDLKPLGISVTTLCPGYVKTPFTDPNKYKMPFVMSAEKAALIIANAIEKKKIIKIFPFPIYLLMMWYKFQPRNFYVWSMRLISKIFYPKCY